MKRDITEQVIYNRNINWMPNIMSLAKGVLHIFCCVKCGSQQSGITSTFWFGILWKLSGHLGLMHKQEAKYQKPWSRGLPMYLFTRLLCCVKCLMLHRGIAPIIRCEICWKVYQIIYNLDTNFIPISMRLAHVVLWKFCSQAYLTAFYFHSVTEWFPADWFIFSLWIICQVQASFSLWIICSLSWCFTCLWSV